MSVCIFVFVLAYEASVRRSRNDHHYEYCSKTAEKGVKKLTEIITKNGVLTVRNTRTCFEVEVLGYTKDSR